MDDTIRTLQIDNLKIGTSYNYLKTHLFFDACIPEESLELTDTFKDYLKTGDSVDKMAFQDSEKYKPLKIYPSMAGEQSSDPIELAVEDASIHEVISGDLTYRLFVWQNRVFEVNAWNSKISTYTNNTVSMAFKWYEYTVDGDATEHTLTLTDDKAPKVYYEGNNVIMGKTDVNLPLTAFERGAYDFDIIYPATRNYSESSTHTQLAYQSWNYPSHIECLDVNDDDTIIINPESTMSGIRFRVTDDSGKNIQTGDVELKIESLDMDTLVTAGTKNGDLYDVLPEKIVRKLGADSDLVYRITTVGNSNNPVSSGDLNISMTSLGARYEGDCNSVDEWESTVNNTNTTTENPYIRASASNDQIGMGANCLTYWDKFALVNNTYIKANVTSKISETYAVGLMDTSSHELICKFKVTGSTAQLIQGETTTEITPSLDINIFRFVLVDNKLQLYVGKQTSTETTYENPYDIGMYYNSYNIFFETYNITDETQADSVSCTKIVGGYGVDDSI